MKIMREFKEFATKGNVIDLAIAVVIGGAFGKIVTSFVDSIVMPLLGILLGGKDFSQLVWQVGKVQITYGIFIQNIINFIIIALAIFIVVVKFMGSMKNKEVVEKKGPSQEELLTEIRDLLKVK